MTLLFPGSNAFAQNTVICLSTDTSKRFPFESNVGFERRLIKFMFCFFVVIIFHHASGQPPITGQNVKDNK